MTMTIDSEMSAFRIQQDFNIFIFEPFADKESLAEQVHIAMFGDLAEEGDPSSGNGQEVVWDEIVERQFAKFGSPAILHRGQSVQAGLNTLAPHCVWCSAGVFGIDRLFQSLQFAFQSAKLRVVPLK